MKASAGLAEDKKGSRVRKIPKNLRGLNIQVLTPKNPRNRGTERHRNFQLVAEAGGTLSVEEFYARGGTSHHLNMNINEGHFKLLSNEGLNGHTKPSTQPPTQKVLAVPPPTPKKDPNEVLPKEFDTLLKLASVGQNILMVGPSGSGKTFLASKVAQHLGRTFYAQSCSAGMSESQLSGWLLPSGEGGRFEYAPSTFVKAYEEGGVFLFDEVDAADENTMIFINSALANGEFFLPQRLGNPRVKRHKDFVAIAAANTYGHGESIVYAGRNRLDGATLDRFRAGCVRIEYSPKVEAAICDEEVLAWGRGVRKLIFECDLERIMSTRVLVDFTRQKRELGWGKRLWATSYFSDWSKDELSKARKEGLLS